MTIKLQYFKSSGKCYTDGEFELPSHESIHECVRQVQARHSSGTLPGLASGRWFGPILVTVDDLPHLIHLGDYTKFFGSGIEK